MSELAALAADGKRWLFDTALPLWARDGVDPGNGGFLESIALDGTPVHKLRRARVQARQVYVYAVAGVLGWPGPWRETLEAGFDFFVRAYRRPDGLFRTTVGEDGAPVDETPHLYDHAFALFAMAAMARALPQRAPALEGLAHETLAAVEAHFRHDGRGLREASDARPFQANPHMHLFEAALAWEETGGDARWAALADRIAALCLERFVDPEGGFLREFFTADWTPAAGEDGRMVEPGHQFEWAWLLQRWGVARGQAQACKAARRMYETAVNHGIDPGRGVAINVVSQDLAVIDASARLWPQTERIKAALIMARAAPDAQGRAGCEAEAAAGVRGLNVYLDVQTPGLWRDRYLADGGFVDEPAPASSFYHIVCALAELLAAASAP